MKTVLWVDGLNLPKNSEDIELFSWDFTDWLETNTIATVEVTSEAGLTAVEESHTTTKVVVRASAGVVGKTMWLKVKVTDSIGRIATRPVNLIIS